MTGGVSGEFIDIAGNFRWLPVAAEWIGLELIDWKVAFHIGSKITAALAAE